VLECDTVRVLRVVPKPHLEQPLLETEEDDEAGQARDSPGLNTAPRFLEVPLSNPDHCTSLRGVGFASSEETFIPRIQAQKNALKSRSICYSNKLSTRI
jgi:hypothetical protein